MPKYVTYKFYNLYIADLDYNPTPKMADCF